MQRLWYHFFFLHWFRINDTEARLLQLWYVMPCMYVKINNVRTLFHLCRPCQLKIKMKIVCIIDKDIDFVFGFSWSFGKKMEEIFNGMSIPRLWYSVSFLHWCRFLLFMKLQQKKLEGICNGFSIPRLWYNIFFWHLRSTLGWQFGSVRDAL